MSALDPVAAASIATAKAARALLRAGVREQRFSRDEKTVTLVVDAASLDALRGAVTAWDDAAHDAVTGGQQP